MLSFKNNQNVQPLYDYYVETDLDSFDDQPVDYSKKYADQDSYDECRRRKPSLKSGEFSNSEVTQTIKQSCNDEVKVYCIEGTPLTISSASSFCDLRDVGTGITPEKSSIKHSSPPVNEEENLDTYEGDCKKGDETLDTKKEESSLSKEKDDTKEIKTVSFRSGDDISKASSPLMFSRSSSVASLNSFEQQSIIDDRSSVSAFSALTSGLISPSDLPDSPGEIMSPALTDKASSPKIDVTKTDSDNELENAESLEKGKLNDVENLNDSENIASTQIPISKPQEYIQLDSFKSERNYDEEDNEILTQDLEISNDSVEIDEVFTNSDHENTSFSLLNERELGEQLSKSDEDSDVDDILLQKCIQLGMPTNPTVNKCNVNPCQENEFQPHPHSVPISKLEIKNNHPVKLDDDSDDDDALLQRCIQLGMPENTPSKVVTGAAAFIKSRFSPHPINYSSENDLFVHPATKSDDDSDGDDILLQQCIQLGMPNKLPKPEMTDHVYKRMECPAVSAKVNNTQQVQHKNEKIKSNEILHCNQTNMIPQSCMSYRMPFKMNDKIGMCPKPVCGMKYPSSDQSGAKNVPRKIYPVKTNGDSDGEENDVLLQHCIQRGMPKDSQETKMLQHRIFRKPENDSHSANYRAPNDLRDDCPDGISDVDEEDDLLAKCIRAGMPSPKTTPLNRSHVPQTANTSRRLTIPNRPFLQDPSNESEKKFSPSRLPPSQPYAPVHSSTTWLSSTSFIDVDSMRIYRTEDTPILSPSLSISDLSSLSFNESFLNNSRNSDCSSDSDDDELLQQCIRSGMPEAKRAVA